MHDRSTGHSSSSMRCQTGASALRPGSQRKYCLSIGWDWWPSSDSAIENVSNLLCQRDVREGLREEIDALLDVAVAHDRIAGVP